MSWTFTPSFCQLPYFLCLPPSSHLEDLNPKALFLPIASRFCPSLCTMERKIPLLACLLDCFFLLVAPFLAASFSSCLTFFFKNFIELLLFSLYYSLFFSLLVLLPPHGLRSDDHVFGSFFFSFWYYPVLFSRYLHIFLNGCR